MGVFLFWIIIVALAALNCGVPPVIVVAVFFALIIAAHLWELKRLNRLTRQTVKFMLPCVSVIYVSMIVIVAFPSVVLPVAAVCIGGVGWMFVRQLRRGH